MPPAARIWKWRRKEWITYQQALREDAAAFQTEFNRAHGLRPGWEKLPVSEMTAAELACLAVAGGEGDV